MLSKGIDNREMKSESGFSFAIASQPFQIVWILKQSALMPEAQILFNN